jgi:hypothetical protein
MTFEPQFPIGRLTLACVWLRNPATGKLECRWQRLARPVTRREIIENFAKAA